MFGLRPHANEELRRLSFRRSDLLCMSSRRSTALGTALINGLAKASPVEAGPVSAHLHPRMHRLLQGRDRQRGVQGGRGRADTAGRGWVAPDAVRPSGFGAAPGGCVPRSHLCPATRIPAAAKTRELRSTERRVIDQKLATPTKAPPRHPDRHCATAVYPLTILCFRGAHRLLRHSGPTAPAKMAPRVADRGI